MNTKQVIRLSLLSSLLMVLNGCGDGSSNKSHETQNEQEVNNAGTEKAPVITLKGNSQVNIIQGSSYSELGATAVDSEGKNLEVTQAGKVDATVVGSYTIVYSTEDSNGRMSSIVRTVQVIVIDVNVNVNVNNGDTNTTTPTVRKNYYLVPIAKQSTRVSNVDLISGEVNLGVSDIHSNKGGLSLTRLYSSYDDQNKSVGTFKTNYESRLDAPLAENIKSKNYETIEASCTEGWFDIDEKAFRKHPSHL